MSDLKARSRIPVRLAMTGAEVREWRGSCSIPDLGARVGVTNDAVYKWERHGLPERVPFAVAAELRRLGWPVPERLRAWQKRLRNPAPSQPPDPDDPRKLAVLFARLSTDNRTTIRRHAQLLVRKQKIT